VRYLNVVGSIFTIVIFALGCTHRQTANQPSDIHFMSPGVKEIVAALLRTASEPAKAPPMKSERLRQLIGLPPPPPHYEAFGIPDHGHGFVYREIIGENGDRFFIRPINWYVGRVPYRWQDVLSAALQLARPLLAGYKDHPLASGALFTAQGKPAVEFITTVGSSPAGIDSDFLEVLVYLPGSTLFDVIVPCRGWTTPLPRPTPGPKDCESRWEKLAERT